MKGRLVDRHLVGHFCKSLSQQSNCYDGGIECVQTATNAGEEVEVEVVEVAVAGDGDGDGDGALRGSRVRVALDFVFARRANSQETVDNLTISCVQERTTLPLLE